MVNASGASPALLLLPAPPSGLAEADASAPPANARTPRTSGASAIFAAMLPLLCCCLVDGACAVECFMAPR